MLVYIDGLLCWFISDSLQDTFFSSLPKLLYCWLFCVDVAAAKADVVAFDVVVVLHSDDDDDDDDDCDGEDKL